MAVSLGGTVEVSVPLGSGVTVWVTVSGGAPGPPRRRVGSAGVVVAVVETLAEGVGVVVVAGPWAGAPDARLITAYTARPSTTTPAAPAPTSANGRRYHGVGGSGRPGSGS